MTQLINKIDETDILRYELQVCFWCLDGFSVYLLHEL